MKMNMMQKGFTLVELAIVLLIVGLIVGATFGFMTVKREQDAQQITMAREQKIAAALAYYAQVHNTLPCPAKPKPTVVTDPVGNPDVITCGSAAGTAEQRNGIVPFRLLGLTRQDVTDAFGNPITYVVSATAANPDNTKVEAACRTSIWTGTAGSDKKAAFCCSQNRSPPLRIFTDSGSMTNAGLVTQTQVTATGGIYLPYSSTATSSVASTVSYLAYALISHGKNDMGSYTLCSDTAAASCNNNRKDPANAGTNEKENGELVADDDYIAGLRSTAGSTANFDDIVLWRTQDRIISEFNNDSCAKP